MNVTKGIPPPPTPSSGEEETKELKEEEGEGEGVGVQKGPSQKESEGRIITLEFENHYLIATCKYIH